MSMQSIMAASQSMARMQTMQSARTQMQGSANILRIESKQDGGNAEKLAKAYDLEKKSSNLMGDLMGEITDVNETLKPDEEAKVEEKQEDTLAKKVPRQDKVTLSDYANGYKETLPAIQPVKGEAVTYDAAGSKAPSASAKAAPSFEVRA